MVDFVQYQARQPGKPAWISWCVRQGVGGLRIGDSQPPRPDLCWNREKRAATLAVRAIYLGYPMARTTDGDGIDGGWQCKVTSTKSKEKKSKIGSKRTRCCVGWLSSLHILGEPPQTHIRTHCLEQSRGLNPMVALPLSSQLHSIPAHQ